MLFAKSRGTSLVLDDWLLQAGAAQSGAPKDPVLKAGERLWQAISGQRLPYAKAIHQLEKQVLEIAGISLQEPPGLDIFFEVIHDRAQVVFFEKDSWQAGSPIVANGLRG